MTDNFQGDNAKLVECINALLELDASGNLAPHGIGGSARSLLEASAFRIAALAQQAGAVELRDAAGVECEQELLIAERRISQLQAALLQIRDSTFRSAVTLRGIAERALRIATSAPGGVGGGG